MTHDEEEIELRWVTSELIDQIDAVLRERFDGLCMDVQEERLKLADWIAAFLIGNVVKAVRETRIKYQKKI